MPLLPDYRMITGIRPQPSGLEQLTGGLLGGLQTGLSLGDYLRKQQLEQAFRQQTMAAVNPETGEVNQSKLYAAAAAYDPGMYFKTLGEQRKAEMDLLSAKILQDYMARKAKEQGGAAGAAQTGPSPDTLVLTTAGGLTGNQGLTQLGTMQNAWDVENNRRNNEIVEGYIPGVGPVRGPRSVVGGLGGVPSAPGAPPAPTPPAPSDNINFIPKGGGTATISKSGYGAMSPIDQAAFWLLVDEQDRPRLQQALGAAVPTAAPSSTVTAPVPPGAEQLPNITLDQWLKSNDQQKLSIIRSIPKGLRDYWIQRLYSGYNGNPVVGQPLAATQPPTVAQPSVTAPPGVWLSGEPPQEKTRQAVEQANQIEQNKAAVEQQYAPLKRTNELSKEGEKAWIESVYKPALGEYQVNQSTLGNLQLMKADLGNASTGPGANFWMGVKQFLVGAGVPEKWIDVTPQQTLVARSNALVWDMLAKQKGPQTDLDFSRMQAIYPSLDKTTEANQFLIDSSTAILKRRQQQIQFFRDNFQKYADSPSALEVAWSDSPEGKKSIWDTPDMRKWKAKIPAESVQGAAPAAAPGGATGPTLEELQAELARRQAARGQ